MCETDFAIYAGDKTPYVSGDDTDDIIKSLENDYINVFKWFLHNQIKGNSSKCHTITGKRSCICLKLGNVNIENSACEKVRIDNKLNFNEYLDGIIKKASPKVSVLCRIFPYLKRRFLMNSFFTSQYIYCSLI